MTRRFLARISLALVLLAAIVPVVVLQKPGTALAAASMYVSASSPIRVGDTIAITINTNTGGASANSWDAHFTYPSGMFDVVRGSTTGSVCNIWITQPEPDSGSADISCGKPGGFTGTGLLATIYLSAKSDGSATFGLTSCTVLANDGNGTDITGGCSGKTIDVNPVSSTATPFPSATPTKTPTPTVNATNTPKPVTSPKSPAPTPTVGATKTPLPGGTAVPADTAQNVTATEAPTPPPAAALPSDAATPTPSDGAAAPSATPDTSTEKRSISAAFKGIFTSVGDIKSFKGDVTGSVALLLAMIPFLAIMCAILFLIYRLYLLEQRRRRTLDRLFEMELSELAALEGKMDLLAEKGSKGREEYRDEFEKTKEKILRELKPNYGKPVPGDPEPKKPDA